MVSRERTEFLYASIADMQATIRGLDFKAWVLIGSLSLPAATLSGVASLTLRLICTRAPFPTPCIVLVFAVVLVLSWSAAAAMCLRAIGGIINPAKGLGRQSVSADLEAHLKGSFFPVAEQRFSFIQSLLNINPPSIRNFAEYAAALPTDVESVERELIFQHMKLAYVSAWKLALIKHGYAAAGVGLISATLLWLAHLAF